MHFRNSIIGSIVTLTLAGVANASEVAVDRTKLNVDNQNIEVKKSATTYIVQLKEQPGIAKAQELGELMPSNQAVGVAGNNYNANTANMKAYTAKLKSKQQQVAKEIGDLNIIHSFKHTFNGFTTKLDAKQKALLENHPDVAGVWVDKLEQVTTANTPEFLGLTGAGGQHALNIKGEDIVIGVMDTGVTPEHPSFADDGSYSDPASIGWEGVCDAGEEAEGGTFTCNNKLIGARYYKDSFESTYEVQYELGEFASPRDADGHGNHTASTAGGNADVAADISGLSAGSVSGIAPRARIAVYKTCWNSDYVSPEGVNERGCFYGDNMAAIDQAVVDGVDVINYSIGGSLTDLTTPTAAAMLRATEAGVFVSVSAGNSGPDAETVGTPAPWVASVAASTYDGTSLLAGTELIVDGEETLVSIPAGFAPLADDLAGELVATDSAIACNDDPIVNGEMLDGKVALISRGACAFTEKFINAQNAGAIGVVLYTTEGTTPFSMGGSDPAVAIPGVMISYEDGQGLLANLAEGETTVTFTQTQIGGEAPEVGNIMASFSSRGPNKASYDIIKPDITAPGVKILAATTNTPMFGAQGNQFAYLQGTSMSSPHIAGMAALFKESHPEWSPAQIKSALMTTARQDIVKEDGLTPADPFDFGGGHAAPVAAMAPGLTFNANVNDYLAFMCGLGEDDFVSSTGAGCEALEEAGFSFDASQLNIASIGIAELQGEEVVSRTVTNVTDSESTYTATIEMPEGIDVTLATFDSEGAPIADNVLTVPAGGTASFALTFNATEAAQMNAWVFGSITWTDGVHTVRSPIAVKAIPEVSIVVPETISAELNRGRLRFPVEMLYSGTTSLDYAGLVAPFGADGTVAQDPDADYSFNEPGLGFNAFLIPEGTKVARFSLRDSLVDVEGADLDLYVYRCDQWSCTLVGQSFNGGSNEDVVLVNPEPRANGDIGDVYITFTHGWSLAGEATANYVMPVWVADAADRNTRVYSSRRAIQGRFNYVTIMARGLAAETVYMGGITFYDNEGVAQGTTVVEVSN